MRRQGRDWIWSHNVRKVRSDFCWSCHWKLPGIHFHFEELLNNQCPYPFTPNRLHFVAWYSSTNFTLSAAISLLLDFLSGLPTEGCGEIDDHIQCCRAPQRGHSWRHWLNIRNQQAICRLWGGMVALSKCFHKPSLWPPRRREIRTMPKPSISHIESMQAKPIPNDDFRAIHTNTQVPFLV